MRPEKESMLNELKDSTDDSVFVLFADFSRIKMSQSEALRTEMRKHDAKVKMVKNRMYRLVARENGLEDDMAEHLTGATGMIYGNGDVGAVAKALKNFVKDNEVAAVKMGSLEGAFVSADDIKVLADLPSREELLSQLLGCFLAPAQNIANLLNNSMGELGGLIAALEDKLKDEG